MFDAVLSADPQNLVALNGKGVALDSLGEHGEAQTAYHVVLAATPDNVAAQNNLALSYILSEHYADAVRILEKLLKSKQGDRATVRQNLALAYGLQGNHKKALELGLQDLSAKEAEENLKFYDYYQSMKKSGEPAYKSVPVAPVQSDNVGAPEPKTATAKKPVLKPQPEPVAEPVAAQPPAPQPIAAPKPEPEKSAAPVAPADKPPVAEQPVSAPPPVAEQPAEPEQPADASNADLPPWEKSGRPGALQNEIHMPRTPLPQQGEPAAIEAKPVEVPPAPEVEKKPEDTSAATPAPEPQPEVQAAPSAGSDNDQAPWETSGRPGALNKEIQMPRTPLPQRETLPDAGNAPSPMPADTDVQ